MPDKLTHDEFDRRVREAMNPPAATQAGQSLAPGIQRMRQGAKLLKPQRPNRIISQNR